ncbi:MAG TPA: hypothetical protein VGU71_12265 [Candidatus Dormibacteraeota bacterium]|nr:hypothetical protein [Candidatus Dormibacteraeota bacterium]
MRAGDLEVAPIGTGGTSVASLTLPTGKYEISLVVNFLNNNNSNTSISCDIEEDQINIDLAGSGVGQLSWHKASSIVGGPFQLLAICRAAPIGVGSNHTNVFVMAFSLTATTVAAITIQ